MWINNFLAPDVQFKNYRDLTTRLDDLIASKNRELKDILTDYDFSYQKVVENIQPVTVRFYNYKKSGNRLENIYLDDQSLGGGFILTSDGWLVTNQNVITDPKKPYSVQIGNKVYEVNTIFADTLTEVILVKIDANNLPVADLGSSNSLISSQTVLLSALGGNVVRTTVKNLNYADINSSTDLIQSSENYYRYVLLDGSFDKIYLGSPIVGLSGKIIGLLLSSDGLVLPIDNLANVMKSIVQKGEVERSFLGVNYLDLQLVPNFDVNTTKGAYLISGSRPAVIPDSPASKVGLKAGDIIIKVESDEVNEKNSLTRLIQDYQIGADIQLTIIRDGAEQKVNVVLEKL